MSRCGGHAATGKTIRGVEKGRETARVTRAEVGWAGVEGREIGPAAVIIGVVLGISWGVIVREEERRIGRVPTDEGRMVMGCLLMVLVVRVMWLEDVVVILLRDMEVLKRGSMIYI